MSLYLRVLRHPNFRFLFLGQAVSAIGDGVVVVAIALYVTQSTGSASELGLVLGAQALTLVTLLLFGGVWADRLPRQRIMIATDLVRAALHALLAVLIFSGTVAIWQLVVIEAGYGAAQAFFQPAYSGLVPQTVPEELILDARGLTEWMANLASLLGPALATVLVLGVGAGEAFAFEPRPSSSARCCSRACTRVCGAFRRPLRSRSRARCARGGARCAGARGCGSRSWSSPERCSACTRSGTRLRLRSPASNTAAQACSA